MKRSRVFAFLLFVATILSIATPALAGPIRLWHAYSGDEEKALQEILKQWKGEPIDALSLPYDAYKTKLSAAIPLGEGPDLYIDSHERLGDYRERKIVAPVGDALEEGVFSPRALEAVSIDGAAWAVPLSQKCLALYVNSALVKEVPVYLEDMAELRARLPEGVVPLAYDARGTYGLAAMFSAFGGSMLTNHDQFGFVGPEAEQTLELAGWLIKEKVIPEDIDSALITNLFRSGQAAFAVSGPWLASDLGDKVPWRVVPLPKIKKTGQPMRPLLTVESVMLSPQGAQKPEVRALARLLAGRGAAEIRMRLGPTPSARSDVALPEGDAPVRAFARQADDAVPMPSALAMGAVWEPSRSAIRKVLTGDAPAPDALAEAKRRFDDVRRPLPPPASPTPAILAIGVVLLMISLRWVKQAREENWAEQIRKSRGAYRYVLHAVVAVGVLVILPLAIGAGTSLFAGSDEARRYVGLANFINILTARGGPLLTSGSFYLVLLVTVLWTLVNVFFHVAIGVVLALVLSRPTMRLRALYRVLLILPWAVPSYVTALAWKGMFHRQFGAVTGLILGLNDLFGTSLEPIAWFSRFSTAFTANVATNVWLGFPFMMVVTLGALTAVPEDVLEAAKVDGATRFQRLWLVTIPIIRPTLMPAVTLGAIWTFNMFNVVFLVSGGDPDGTTDILVSEAYRWAFTRQNQYGYAAAYAVLIFLLLFLTTRAGSRKGGGEKPSQDKAPSAIEAGTEVA